MTIKTQTEETLIRRTTTIDRNGDSDIVVLDYLNDDGNVVDTVYRDEAGNELDDPALIETIESFMAEQLFPGK